MRGVEVDPDTGRSPGSRPGCSSLELGEAANAHGLCSHARAPRRTSASSATRSAAASAGWARKHGFACNRVAAIELVTADGEQRTVDADNDPDLFWALRGGGGGYAIVTALHLDLLPIAEIYAGALLFPAEVGAEAVRTYRDWADSVSDDVTSVVRFVTPPPIPDVPEPLRGTPLLTIDGACIGTQAEGEAAFAPLREIGETIMDTFEWMPTAELSRIHMDPENPVPGVGDGAACSATSPTRRSTPWSAWSGPARVAAAAQRAAPPGRRARSPGEDGGALSHLDAGFAMYSVGDADDPGAGRGDPPGHLEKIDQTMQPWAAEGGYFNFTEAPATSTRSFPPTSATASPR